MKKLISTSFAVAAKEAQYADTKGTGSRGKKTKDDPNQMMFAYEPTAFETASARYDKDKTRVCCKIFVLDHDTNANGRIDIDDLEWDYLKGDGDFRSDEIKALRDEADMIVTNPPFSLFREFLAWIMESGKKFAIIGNMNAITYKEVFPLIMQNRIWVENPFVRGAAYFTSPYTELAPSYYNSHDYQEGFIRVPGVRWFTNIETGRRHQPLSLMTLSDNITFSKHKEVRGVGYLKYDNYDAIEVPFSDAIPADYDGVMGVPISYLDKYCPEQFEIVGNEYSLNIDRGRGYINGKRQYSRIFIRFKRDGGGE